MKPYILALDLGTTGNRALVFDHNQKIVSQFYEEFSQIYPKPGWVEHDAEEIWQSVQKILKQTFKKISADKIEAIGITNQRETVVLWDKNTHKPIHNAIVWQCRRTAEACEKLKKRGLGPLIHKKTGLVIDAYFSASKIQWLLDYVPGARKKASQGRLLAGTIDSWIVYQLSRGCWAHVTDTSNASRTMLFNIHTMRWDDKLCKIFNIPKKMLPRVVASSSKNIASTHSGITGGVSIPIHSIIGDQQAATFAQGCFAPGLVKNTYGTGLFAVENTGHKPRFSKNLLTTVAWSIGNLSNTEYAVEGSVFIGGAAIQWLRDGLKIIRNAKETENLAKSLDSNQNVYFVPALVGLGAPYWDPDARGMIIGITRGTNQATLVRATLEAITYQTRDILEIMKKDTHESFKILKVDGGATANNFLMQFQADVLGIPVERPVILETTALGAAGLAGLACGFWKSKEEFNRQRKIEKVFKPSRKFSKEELYKKWQKAVERSRHWVNA